MERKENSHNPNVYQGYGCFYDPEVFFDLPVAFVDVEDFTDILFRIRYHCMETIIHEILPGYVPHSAGKPVFVRFFRHW